VLNLLHQVWLAGLGAVSLAGQEAAKLVDQLVEKGKEMEPAVIDRGKKVGEEISDAAEEVGMRIRDVAARVSKRAEAAEAMMDERVRAALDRMGYATKEDFEGLSAKLDALMARLEELGTRRGGKKPSGENEPVQ
jgi:poly(hydroxyalkanoate) granule-associated protein